jgi:hypothetical protein
MKPRERKLYKVVLNNGYWTEQWEQVHYVEAQNHQQAVELAYDLYNEARILKAKATHIPFAEVRSVGESVRETVTHPGDGTHYFESATRKVLFWYNPDTFPAGVFGALLGAALTFIICTTL